jgi:hypothetical protein
MSQPDQSFPPAAPGCLLSGACRLLALGARCDACRVPPLSSTVLLPPGWRPLAAGLTNGETLLLVDGLHLVRVQPCAGGGYAIEKTSLDVLRVLFAQAGLVLCNVDSQ